MERTICSFLLVIAAYAGWAQTSSGTSVAQQQDQGICFYSGNWEEVCRKAAGENKVIFLDVYTSWCGPCKKMASEVFTLPEVGSFFNTHFINYKIDAEKGEGIKLAERLGVKSYPSCFFLSPKEKIVASFVGAKNQKAILAEGKKALTNFELLPKLVELENCYLRGERNKDFLSQFCAVRKDFGEKGGKPLEELVDMLTDEELLRPDNAQWVQDLTTYNVGLMRRLCYLLANHYPKQEKKTLRKLNAAVMKWMSSCFAQALDENLRENFDSLIKYKKVMNHIDASNNDNGLSASIGGGMAYLATEQLLLNFYGRNHYDQEFQSTFLSYMQQQMNAIPIDSLMKSVWDMEQTYQTALNSDTINEKEKEALKQGHSFLQMMNGVKYQLLSISLYNAAERYWKMKQPAEDDLKQQYAEWLKFCYALQRNNNMGIPVARKLRELGLQQEARQVVKDLADFLSLQKAPEDEIARARKLLAEMEAAPENKK